MHDVMICVRQQASDEQRQTNAVQCHTCSFGQSVHRVVRRPVVEPSLVDSQRSSYWHVIMSRYLRAWLAAAVAGYRAQWSGAAEASSWPVPAPRPAAQHATSLVNEFGLD
jgi:hypothetical protein